MNTPKPFRKITKNFQKCLIALQQIKEEFPHLVHGNVAFARKMGFPEVIFPGDVRNDLYLTLVNGEFSKSSKSSDKNVEVTAVVCDEKGQIVPSILTLGAGASMLSEYKSVIYYHDDKPKWNETFKIELPIEEFKNCHLRFTFKHRSSNEVKDKAEKPFGLSYVRLMQDNGTTLQHKCHQLIVYKIDHKKYDKDTLSQYLKLPSRSFELNTNEKPTAGGLTISPKDSFTILTNLCSTKLTQDGEIFDGFCFIFSSYSNIVSYFVLFSRFIGTVELVNAQRNFGRLIEFTHESQSRGGCEIFAGYFGCAFQHSCSK